MTKKRGTRSRLDSIVGCQHDDAKAWVYGLAFCKACGAVLGLSADGKSAKVIGKAPGYVPPNAEAHRRQKPQEGNA